jgi:hypothetical protein
MVQDERAEDERVQDERAEDERVWDRRVRDGEMGGMKYTKVQGTKGWGSTMPRRH